MTRQHTVILGEHLASIAEKESCSPARILNHPANAPWRNRPHPAMLDPGDVLSIPPIQSKHLSMVSGQAHRVVLQRPSCHLDVSLQTFRQDATNATSAHVQRGPAGESSCSIDESRVRVAIPPSLRQVLVEVAPAEPGGWMVHWTLEVGALPRSESDAGALARLRNLGYYRQVAPEDDELERRSAIEEFQCDHGLRLTGALDDVVKRHIAKVYGC